MAERAPKNASAANAAVAVTYTVVAWRRSVSGGRRFVRSSTFASVPKADDLGVHRYFLKLPTVTLTATLNRIAAGNRIHNGCMLTGNAR